nr:intraflagellar transport protein component IFT74/72 [Chlamydomonas reinhardtii]
MDRPSSRGALALGAGGLGKAPTGGAVQQPDRPMTGQRGAAPAGPMRAPAGASIIGAGPPGTAMRGGPGPAGGPPGTAYKRMGTASQRPGTGQQAAAAAAAARAGQQLQVENRPITNHGVSGMKTAAAGVGRQVLDKNYFMNELRQKRMEIAQVTSNMKSDLEALERKQAQYNSMDKRASDLSKEVKILQEALADYNTVLDKVGSQAPVYVIQQEFAALKDRNEQQRKRVDEVLTERLNLESKAKQAESKMSEIQASMDQRLNSMPPSQRNEYTTLVAEQQQLQADSKRFEEVLDELDKALQASEGELARNPFKQRSLQLQEQIRALTGKKYELTEEERQSKRSPEELRADLMAKIKRDNTEVEQMTQQIRELQDQIKKMEERVKSLGGATSGAVAAEEKANREKFEELLAKERHLNNFMDGFPSRKAAKMQEKQQKEDGIVGVLEKMVKMQGIIGSNLPSQKKYKEMQDELEYKKMQLENTQTTQERLKEELTMRRTELEKIDTLEDKIKLELTQLAERQEAMEKEMGEFGSVEDIQRKANAARERMGACAVCCLKRKDLLRSIVAERGLKFQAKRAQLQDHNLQVQLEKMEAKLKNLSAGVFEMDEFIKAKESETNYRQLASNIAALVDDLNVHVKKAVV